MSRQTTSESARRRTRVCLITTGQPSTNPRLVKEADALVEAGCDVHVVAAHWAEWATDADVALLANRRWTCSVIDWRRTTAPATHAFTRVRHWAARRAATVSGAALPAAALSRVGPDLKAAARRQSADLYIAHNLGALPAALAAAAPRGRAVGFDAEDFHSGQLPESAAGAWRAAIRRTEKTLLARCTYVTAASPGIAAAYRALCDIPEPSCVLNVFPRSARPAVFRPSQPDEPVRLYWFSQTIGPDRGLEDAVRALGILARRDVELHLRGIWQRDYEPTLRRLAAECGVPNDAIAAHAPAAPDEMVRLAAEADIGLALEPGVTVNNDIAVSNKLFTYVLAGTALVASNTSGQARVVTQLPEAALSYACGSPSALAEALRPWVANREALNRARAAAWALGEERFNWDLEKRVFLDVVNGVLNAARASSEGVVGQRLLRANTG